MSQVEPAATLGSKLIMDTNAKRKALSPCESNKLKSSRNISPSNKSYPDCVLSCDLSLQSIDENSSFASAMSDNEKMECGVTSVSYTIQTRNGESFKGAVDRPIAKRIWELGLNLPGTMIYGISLNQSPDRFFLIDFELHQPIEWEECPSTYEVKIGEITYAGRKFIEKPIPPELGEEVEIRIKKTRFKLKPDQVHKWISCFGKVLTSPDFENAPDLPTVKCCDIILTAKLRKHIPSVLPAYGRKMMVWYPGQPVVCGKCFERGHVRAKCDKDVSIPWLSYVKVFKDEDFVSREMLGTWADLLDKKAKEKESD